MNLDKGSKGFFVVNKDKDFFNEYQSAKKNKMQIEKEIREIHKKKN